MNIADLHRRVEASGSLILFTDEYNNILEFAKSNNIPIPNKSQNILNNQKIKRLIELNIWQETDLFYFFRQDCHKDFAKINWKNPSSFYLTSTNEPLFINNQGFQGGSGLFFNTNYNLLNNRNFFEGNNAFISFKCFNIPTIFNVNNNILGVRTANNLNQIYVADNLNNTFLARVFSQSSFTLDQQNKNKNFIVKKIGNQQLEYIYIDGLFFSIRVNSNTENVNLPNLNLYLLALNQNNIITTAVNNIGMEYFVLGKGSAIDGKEFEFNEIITQA